MSEKRNDSMHKEEALSLDDGRRVKVLSPGMMVFKRFIRNRLAIAGINLCKLESRPIAGREFEFRFFFDMEADLHDPEVVKLICELESRTEHFVFLGAYEER